MLYRLDKLSFCYGQTPVLEDVSLELQAGTFYGILGPNGSGKTTFLDLISGHKRPSGGSIRFNGRNLDRYGKKELARQIAMVPQDFALSFPFRVEEIVLMGRYPHLPRFAAPAGEDQAMARLAMEQTGTAEFGNRYITELSGGEKQRVIFARALAQQTPVLLLDEATSNLDVKYGLQLLQLARQRNRLESTTVVAVFHDVNQAACFCDELLFFKQGRLLTSGPTATILSPATLKDAFDVQAKVFYEPELQARQVVFKPPEPDGRHQPGRTLPDDSRPEHGQQQPTEGQT
jgi:iron complex transport system ATP-binding protein